MNDYSKLRELERKAKPGEWQVNPPGRFVNAWWLVDERGYFLAEMHHTDTGEDDARFIAAARNALPGLLDELEAARRDVEIAAGAFLVDVPEPGTDMARVMTVNRRLIRERDEARGERQTWIANAHKEREKRLEVEGELQLAERECDHLKAELTAKEGEVGVYTAALGKIWELCYYKTRVSPETKAQQAYEIARHALENTAQAARDAKARIRAEVLTEMRPILRFVESLWQLWCDSSASIDGLDVQELMEEHDITMQELYDPYQHGDSIEAEPGEDCIYVLRPEVNELLKPIRFEALMERER